ncbi:Mu transposase C-terminal domain-containing protein [Solimonas flava]|uniref:Mu transposase C-terminal domain-containing protein n=1 Tax=Solimonas flava TaxID=415849 RepID=UPI00040D23B1|nr:Mu transposase C-terminal domain-containing protein [Solimonas flava]
MAAVLQFSRPLPMLRPEPQLPAVPSAAQQLRDLPDWARMEAERCLAIIRPALARMQQGVSRRGAAQWLASTAEGLPSWKTIDRWLEQYTTGGSNIVALAPKYTGRVRQDYGWEARALELYNRPTKPAYATVAWWLRQEGFDSAQEHLVRRYLKKAPSSCTETGRKRVGQHYYNQNIKPHVIRDASVLPVGFVYEGDGHCCDVYVAHPNTGHPFRPELTTWIDVRSQKIVSWWISESESTQTTLFSLSQALVAHNHVPAIVHTDPGSGFKARLISDEVTGFLAKFSIQPQLAIAGNAKGKGLQEGWFRWFEERCGKRFDTHTSKVRTDDDLRQLRAKVKAKLLRLPTLQEYIAAIRAYIEAWNNEPHSGTDGLTPDQLWAELQQTPLEIPAEAVIRPRKTCTVQRWGVRLDNRWYREPTLADYETRQVIVEFSLHDDERVSCFDLSGRFICDARLVEKKAWLPASRIEEAQQKRLEGQRKRELLRLAENEARARSVLPSHAEPSPLAVGHSLPPPVAPRITVAAPQLDGRATEILAELQTRPAAAPRVHAPQPLSTEEQIAARFDRAMQIEARIAAHEDVNDADAQWLRRYQSTAEYRGELKVRLAFGRLPQHDITGTHAE